LEGTIDSERILGMLRLMTSKAKSVDEYLRGLQGDRRIALTAVREVIIANLPEGYTECMSFGMIGRASAPGQVEVDRLAGVLNLIHGSLTSA